MFRPICAFLLALFISVVLGTAGDVNLLRDDADRTEFEVKLPTPNFINIGDGYFRIVMNGFGPRGERYGPELCGYSYSVAVPKNCNVSVSLADVIWSEWLDIVPAPRCSLTTYHNIVGYADKKLYSQHLGGTADIVYDFIWRGVRVVAVDLLPVEYDPKRGIRYIKRAKVIVNHAGGNGTIYDKRLYSPVFAAMYRSCLVNGDAAVPDEPLRSREWDPTSEGGELLIITRPSYSDEIQRWVDWKLLQGLPTHIVTTDSTGTDTASVKEYIQNAYDTWSFPPTYVLLVGDDEHIETFDEWGGCVGDNNYGTVDGGDIIPDILPGRISADNGTQVDVIVQKHLNFEKEPDTTDDWYARAVGVVNEEDCPYDGGPTDSSYLAAVTYAMEQCSLAGYTSMPLFRDCNDDGTSDVQPYIEAGCGFVNYRGQAWPDWYSPFQNLYDLATGRKCPVNVSITCGTGSITIFGDNNYGEVTTRAGTVLDPRGSVACYGQAAVSSNSLERSSLSKHIFEGFFEAKLNPLASAHSYGKYEMHAEFGFLDAAAQKEFLTSVLLGSPEMLAWTAPIQIPDVSHPVVVSSGPDTIDVVVSVSSVGVENARVSLHQGDAFSYNMTDSTGSTTIIMNVIPGTPLVIVVTGPNIYPYIDTIDVMTGGVAIYCAPVEFRDIAGDGDGIINPGETVSFVPRVTNLGDEPAEALNGIVHINDPEITFIDSSTSFPSISPGDTVEGDTVAFVVSSTHASTFSLYFTITLTGDTTGPWDRDIIPNPAVVRFEASLGAIVIDDSPPYGNGNGELEPGEQAFLQIELTNDTEADVFNLGGTLGDWTYVTSVQPYGEYGDLLRLSSADNYPNFSVSVSPSALPGDNFTLPLEIIGDCPMYTNIETLYVPLSILGSHSGLPTGPDAYGYYIIDDTDSACGLAPTYIWNDITGVGTTIGAITNSDDQITTISLPFTMKFYGNLYDSVSVSSNGFLAPPWSSWSGPGSGSPQPMPDTDGPDGLFAPVWADLAPHRASGGDIYSYYDSGNNQFVIQYDNVQFYDYSGRVTCQVRICDTTAYPTPTGDSEIYFYYQEITSNNFGAGIESPDETTGLQYYLLGVYDENAAPIVAGRALRITTVMPSNPDFPWLHYYDSLSYDDSASDGDGVIEPGDEIAMRFRLKNSGTATALSVTGVAVSTAMITSTGASGNFNFIVPGGIRYNDSTPIGFQVSPSCPSDTYLTVPIAISANSGSYIDTIGFLLHIGMLADVPKKDNVPRNFSSIFAYPNPFNSSVAFEVNIAPIDADRNVDISLYSLNGRKVATIFSGVLGLGRHKFTVRGDEIPSGIYFARMSIGTSQIERKILLVH